MNHKIKQNIKTGTEFFLESIIFYFFFNVYKIENIMRISFARYFFFYLFFYLIIRDKKHNNLIWQDARNIAIFYSVLFITTLVIRPMKEITTIVLLYNLLQMISVYISTVIIKKIIHTLFFNELANNVLIIGVGDYAKSIYETCISNKYSLMNVKGFINCNNKRFSFKQEIKVNKDIVYNYSKLDEFILTNKIDEVIIALPQANKNDLTIIVDILRNKIEHIKYMPQVNYMYSYNTRIEDYNGQLLICNSDENSYLYAKFIKRLFDIVFGIIGTVLLIPLSIVIKFISILNGDSNSIFFKQKRIGKNGKTIIIYKYRSMIINAEEELERIMKKDQRVKNEYLKNKKLENDPRITKIGKILRKTSLDEFPQFLNVLIGNMSLVGPRPYLHREIDDIGIFYSSIIKTKPGITGMWQVSGRSDISFDRRIILDEYYSNNESFWLDFTILIKTVKTVLKTEGAK